MAYPFETTVLDKITVQCFPWILAEFSDQFESMKGTIVDKKLKSNSTPRTSCFPSKEVHFLSFIQFVYLLSKLQGDYVKLTPSLSFKSRFGDVFAECFIQIFRAGVKHSAKSRAREGCEATRYFCTVRTVIRWLLLLCPFLSSSAGRHLAAIARADKFFVSRNLFVHSLHLRALVNVNIAF